MMNKNNTTWPITEVWQKYKNTNRKKYRDILIKHYLPIVKIVAEKLRSHLPGCVDSEDLASAGVFGLTTAIDLYDLKRGIKFETYCVNRIRGSMLDELRTLDWVPRLVRTKSHQLENACTRLEKKLDRPPTDFELARELKLSLSKYAELVKETWTTAILPFSYKNEQDENDQPTEIINLLRDKRADEPFREMLNRDLIEHLKNNLSKKERLVLELYFHEDLTMKEIGTVLNISESRVSQIFASVLRQLRKRFKRQKIEWFA